MNWLFLVIGTVLVVECLLRLPVLSQVHGLTGLLGKITRLLKSASISDHWKEKILPVYAGKLFLFSIRLFALILLCLAPIFAMMAVSHFVSPGLDKLLVTWVGLLASCAIAAVYYYLRKRVIGV